MIEKLTAEKLEEYGFNKDKADKITFPEWEMLLGINDKDFYFASNIEDKIYSGIDYDRRECFKDKSNVIFPIRNSDLFMEYYELQLDAYLIKQKKIAGKFFSLEDECKDFKKIEIARTRELIKEIKEEINITGKPDLMKKIIGKEKNIKSNLNINRITKGPYKDHTKAGALKRYIIYLRELKKIDVTDYLQNFGYDITGEQNETKVYIDNEFKSIKERCFDKGYNDFTNLLTNFFDSKNYSIPKKTIQLNARCKTPLAPVFNTIYRRLKSSKTPLKSDTKYFDIIRVLNHFAGLSDSEIYKTIGRQTK